MPEMLTIQFARPLARIRVLNAAGAPETTGDEEQATSERLEAVIQAERARMAKDLQQQKDRFAQLCQTAGSMAENLDRLYQETLANNRADIAKLAVGIARKILMYKVAQGDYDIQAIVEEALKRAPTPQNIVVRLNSEDLLRCQQVQQEDPDGPFARLEFAADRSVSRGECVVETPKGIVKSFIEEHLDRISEALQRIDN